MTPRFSIIRKTLVAGAVVAGASLGAAGIASAASSTGSASSSTAPAANSYGNAASGAATNPATLTHGPNETLLTGTSLERADAAATAAVPGATIVRAETNSSGASPYEVHMKKADGSYVTVELDSNFKVLTTINGFGAGPAGGQAPSGMAPSSTAA
ncbi:MAG TPA: hypothetical protein VLX59_15380 [Acidimicrobiales bacterium]|nr:hypothetical protein [Acidimicrobiales bacterium]